MNKFKDDDKIWLEKDMWMINLINFENFSVDYLEIDDNAIEENVVHSQIDEWLYIISGEIMIFVGDEKILLKSGEYVAVPKNTVHGSINNSGNKVKMLAVCSPPFKIEYMERVTESRTLPLSGQQEISKQNEKGD